MLVITGFLVAAIKWFMAIAVCLVVAIHSSLTKLKFKVFLGATAPAGASRSGNVQYFLQLQA